MQLEGCLITILVEVKVFGLWLNMARSESMSEFEKTEVGDA